MVSLQKGIILNRRAPQTEVSFDYEKGQIVYIPYDELYKYEFLSLKNQGLESGTFRINDIEIYPEENNDYSVFFLAVNSLVKVGLCFLPKKEDKQDIVKDIQEQLFELRGLPTETNDDKKAKIAAIFGKIRQIRPEYILVDLNEENNKGNSELLNQIQYICADILTIVLEVKKDKNKHVSSKKEAIQEEEALEDLTIGESFALQKNEDKETQDFLVFDDLKQTFIKNVWNIFKNNAMVFFSFLIPTIGVIAFLLLCPLYLQTNNKVLLIPFVITITICFVLYMLMTFKCTTFTINKNEPNKTKKKIIFYIINSLVTLIGIGLGILIYVLFKNFDAELKALPLNKTGIILAIVFSVILITACIYLAQVVSFFINLFKMLINKIKSSKTKK